MMQLFNATVSAIIYNEKNEILLFSNDGEKKWRTVTGWIENESTDTAISREIFEETSINDIKLMDIIDTHSFKYQNRTIISIFYLVKYISGEIHAESDLKGYFYKWFSMNEIHGLSIECPKQNQILEKAFYVLDMYGLDKFEELPFYKFKWITE